MGIVTRTKRVLRRAGNLSESSAREYARAVRPPLWRRGSAKLSLAHHQKLGTFLANSINNLEEAKEPLINGTFKPKNVNDIVNVNVKSGQRNTYFGHYPLTALFGVIAAGSPALLRQTTVGNIGLPVSLFASVLGSAAFSEARKARLFNALNKSVIQARRHEGLNAAQIKHNREVVDNALKALHALVAENAQQMGVY